MEPASIGFSASAVHVAAREQVHARQTLRKRDTKTGAPGSRSSHGSGPTSRPGSQRTSRARCFKLICFIVFVPAIEYNDAAVRTKREEMPVLPVPQVVLEPIVRVSAAKGRTVRPPNMSVFHPNTPCF